MHISLWDGARGGLSGAPNPWERGEEAEPYRGRRRGWPEHVELEEVVVGARRGHSVGRDG